MVKVSVIIPAYNEEKDIGECLRSLREQSYKNKEVIIVDDGSTDRTVDIARGYNARILKQKHGGTGVARNFGAGVAKGDILVFIDADMHFQKDYIKNLVKPILEDKTKKIIGTTHDYEVATNTHNKWSMLWGRVRINKKSAREIKIFRAIRKDKFIELGGFDPKYGYADDQTLWFKYKVKPVVAKDTTCYHKNPDSLKGTYKQARWIGTSWKERNRMFSLPVINYLSVISLAFLFPFLVIYKSVKIKDKKYSFIDKTLFFSYKFRGYLAGLFRAVYLKRFWK